MARVLVVDADDDFRESVRLVLERARHEAHACRDAVEALPLVGEGVRVLVDDDEPALCATLVRSGARVIGVHKPMPPAALLAAVAAA